jgi:hypothetical protein
VSGGHSLILTTPLYLRHPDMQPKVPGLMAPRADLVGTTLKTFVLFARIHTR